MKRVKRPRIKTGTVDANGKVKTQLMATTRVGRNHTLKACKSAGVETPIKRRDLC